MKAAYLKAPFKFEVREVALREIKDDEVLVKVKACGVCGHDMIMASYGAGEWQPFGHEVSGIVERAGARVKNVKEGDFVVLESGTFDRYSDTSRNGRVDLDNKGPNFWLKDDDTMGFAEYIIVPNEVCVKFDGLSFIEASIVEPLGVALDLATTADVKLNDDVLVIGLGPIGLMALKLARAMGARKTYGAELSAATARIELAKEMGVDDVIYTDKARLEDYSFARGGVDRALITAPPKTIPSAINVCNTGGVIAFLGIDYGPGGSVVFDSNTFHTKKLQLRSSFASPALFFPKCIDLLKSGVIDADALITHTFKLDDIALAMKELRDDRGSTVKVVIVNEAT